MQSMHFLPQASESSLTKAVSRRSRQAMSGEEELKLCRGCGLTHGKLFQFDEDSDPAARALRTQQVVGATPNCAGRRFTTS